MLKRWFVIPAMVMALGFAITAIDPLHAQESDMGGLRGPEGAAEADMHSAEEGGVNKERVIFLSSQEFPSYEMIVSSPPDPERKTRFLTLLDKEMRAHNMRLTENVEEADYRVDLRCGGIINCSRLQVYIQTPKRDVLSSYSLEFVRFLYAWPNLQKVSTRLSESLDKNLDLLEQGGYGYR